MNEFPVAIFDDVINLRAVIPVKVVNANHKGEQNLLFKDIFR